MYVSFDIGYEGKIYYQKEYADSTYLLDHFYAQILMLTYKYNRIMQILTAIAVIPSLLEH